MLSFGRFITGALISAFLAVGGVWFVVDQSLDGMRTAVDATNNNVANASANTNARFAEIENDIDKIQQNISELKVGQAELRKDVEVLKKGQTELRANLASFKRETQQEFVELRQEMLREFRATREAIQKTSNELLEQLAPGGVYQFKILISEQQRDKFQDLFKGKSIEIVLSETDLKTSKPSETLLGVFHSGRVNIKPVIRAPDFGGQYMAHYEPPQSENDVDYLVRGDQEAKFEMIIVGEWVSIADGLAPTSEYIDFMRGLSRQQKLYILKREGDTKQLLPTEFLNDI